MTTTSRIRVLSANAPKVGLRRCVEAFSARTGADVSIELLTAPLIKERIASGSATADVVIVPLPILKELGEGGHAAADTIVPIGSVTVGVVIRDGAREPDLGSAASLAASLRAADRVVYNKASSGLYVAGMLEKIGIATAIADRTVIVATGAAVMEFLAADETDAIGFGHITEIRLHAERGTRLVGPLPQEIGRVTTYAAGWEGAVNAGSARDLIAFLASPEGRKVFSDAGVT